LFSEAKLINSAYSLLYAVCASDSFLLLKSKSLRVRHLADVETNAMIEGVSLGISLIESKYTPVGAELEWPF
jgi:hypothetical protein